MWIVEVNVAGYRFTRRVYGRRWPAFRFSPRAVGWRPRPLDHSRAA